MLVFLGTHCKQFFWCGVTICLVHITSNSFRVRCLYSLVHHTSNSFGVGVSTCLVHHTSNSFGVDVSICLVHHTSNSFGVGVSIYLVHTTSIFSFWCGALTYLWYTLQAIPLVWGVTYPWNTLQAILFVWGGNIFPGEHFNHFSFVLVVSIPLYTLQAVFFGVEW